MWNLSNLKQNKQIKTQTKSIDIKNKLVVIRALGLSKMGEGSQKVQIANYKLNKSQGRNVQHGDYS